MSLNWDITAVQNRETLCWQPSTREEGKVELTPVTEALIWCTIHVGMNKITATNYKDFYHRVIEWEVILGTGGIMYYMNENNERQSRMPTLQEIEAHIGLSTNASMMDKRKWGSNLKRLVREIASERIRKAKTEVLV